jgi:long-chain fatty acid transport protein
MQGPRLICFATSALLVTLPNLAQAEDLALTIRPSGLSQIADAARQFFPEEIALETTIEKQLVNCPFTEEDTVATVDNIVAAVEWNDLALRVEGGMLVVDANIDFNVGANLSAVNFYACFGSIQCDASFSTTGLDIVANLALMTGEDGRVTLANSNVDVHLDMTDFALDVEGCALGNLVELVTDFMGNWVLDKLEDRLEAKLGDVMTERVAGLDFVLPEQIDRNGFLLEPNLNQLQLDDTQGIQILGDVSVAGPAGPVPFDEIEASSEALPASFSDGGIAIAASDSLVSKSLAEAYHAGLFDAPLSEAIPTIELSQEGLSQKLGLPPGTTVDVRLLLGAAPTVAFGRGDAGARVALPDVRIDITTNSPNNAEGTMSVQAGIVLDARFVVTDGALGIRVEDLLLEELKIAVGTSTIEPDPVRIQRFIRDVGVPMLSARLSNLPIAPVLQPMEGAFVWMRGLETEGGWLRMGVDLVLPDLNDNVAPETSLPEIQIVAAGLAAVPVAGTDDTTPRELLRYMAWLDGEALTEEPTFLESVRFSAADGEHVLEVAALDLNGNIDDTPSRLDLIVDGTAPELVVESFPSAVVADGVVTASWRATDDRGTAKTRWEIRIAGSDSVKEIVASGDGGANGTLEVQDLSGSELYVLHLIAEDEAGNTTSKEYGFAMEQGGGCSVAGTGDGTWFFGLLLLAMVVGRRRRKLAIVAPVVALVAIGVSGNVVAAQSAGNVLAGATDADGASAFWNPAAMAPGEGTSIDLTANLTYVRLNYDNPDTAGSSEAKIPKPQPLLGAYTDTLGDKWRLGFTLGVPYTSGATWSRDGAEGQTTRFYAAKAQVVHALLTTAASYKINEKISLGAGVNIDYATINMDFDKDFAAKLNATVGGSADSPFTAATPELAAPVTFSMSGFGVGAVGGFLAQPTDRIKVGASVHSAISAKASGRLEAEYPEAMAQFVEAVVPGTVLPQVAGNTELDLEVPLAVFGAVAVVPADTWEISVDYRFLNYADTSNSDIIISQATSPDLKDTAVVRGNKNRHSIGFRTSKSILDEKAVVAVRGRYENNYVAERTYTPSNLDFEKVEVAAILRWSVSERVAIAGQYSKFFLFSQTVDQSLHRSLADPNLDAYNHPAPLGTYSAAADLVSLGVTVVI